MSLFAGVPLHRSDVHISDSYANFLEDLWQCESAEVESVLSEEEIGTWDDPRCETFLSCETSNSAVSLIPGIGELQWLFRNDVSQPSLSEALASESSNLFPFNDVDLEVNLECSENPEDNVSIMCHDAENLDELIPAWHSACVRLGRLPRQDFSLKLTKSLLMKLISEGAVGNVTSPFAIDLVTGKISTRGLLGGTVLSPEAVTNALASIFELGNAVNQLVSLGRKLHKRNVGSHHSWNRVLANVGFFVLKYVCAYRELSCIDLPHEINGHILEDNSRGLVEWKISATLEKIECFGRSSSLLSSIILDLMSRIKKLKITTSLEVIQFLCNAVDRSYVSSERWVAVGVAKFAIDAYMSCLKRGFVEGIDLDDLPDKFTEGSTSCEIIKKLRATVSFKDSEFLNAALRLCAETVGLMKRANTDFETIRELQTMDFAPCYTFLDLSRRKLQLAAFEDMACAEILSVKDQLEEDRRKLESQWAEVIASIEDRSIAVLREIREFQRQESEKIYERKRIVFEQAQAALETYQVELRRRKEEEVFLELKAAKERAEMDAKRASREAALKDEIIAKYSDKNDEMDEETRKMKWREKRLGVGGKKVLQPDQAAEFFSGSLETLPQWARKGIEDPAPVVVKERPLWDKVDGPTEVPQVRLPKWAADHVTVEPFDVESFENRAVERVTNRDKVMGTDLDEILQHSDAAVFGKGRSLEDAKICEPSAAENLGNQSKDEALCKFLSLNRTESNSGKIFEMLETMELPRDVSWDDPSVTGSDLSISIKDPETGSAEDGYKRYYEQKLGIPAVEDACLFSSLIFQSIAVEAKLRLTLVDRAFVSWILNKSGAGVLKKLESVWTLFFLQDPYVSSHLARTLRDEEYCQKWYSKGRSVYGVPEPVFSHVLWQEALESSVDCDSYTDCASTFKFAIQQPPLYKGDCERLPNAVLNCSPAWPLDLLLTPENLEKYNRVFVLLLRLKIISENLLAVYAALKQLTGRSSRDAKNTCAVASNPEYRSFLVQRLEMSHFVSALMQFFESQQIRACLQEFKENLMNEVLSWRHFIHLHSEMVDRVHYRCLLGNDKRSGYLLSLLHRVLDYICSFCELYSSGVWKETEGKLSHSEFIPAHRVYLHFNHISQLLYRDTKMASVSFILSGLLITLSYTNGASLSDSPLFSAALATSPYGYLNLQPAPTLFQRLASAMLQRSPYDVAVKAAPEEEEDTSNVISLPIPIFVPKAGMDDFEAEQNKAKVEAIVKAVSEAVQDFKTRTSNVNDTVETRDGLSAPIPSLCSSRRKDSQFGNHNYQYSWINTPKLDWFNSRNFCRRQCMDAVSIETQAEEEYVKSILIDAWRQGRIEFIWTSGRLCDFPGCDRADLQPIRTNGWFWSGSGVGIPAIGRGYTDWGISISSGTQPDNREGGESCIAMLNPSIYNESSGQFKWHDIACGHQKHVICEDSESLLGYVRQSNPGIVL